MWVMGEVTESGAKAEQAALFLLWPLPHRQCHKAAKRVAFPTEYLRLHPLHVTGALRQRNMAQIKAQIKAPEKELSNEEITNLSDAEFKTLVIRMLTEMVAKYRKK